jgi:NodT family efflux transporter outer membrane factor (OMF) lipoprotein
MLAGLLITGCKVGPDYRQPELNIPGQFSSSPAQSATTQPTTRPAEDLSRWWTVFQDPALDSLIERAGKSNLDLKLAAARLREAKAARGIVAAGLWPTANLSGSASRYKGSEKLPGMTIAGFENPAAQEQSNYQIGTDALWELDIFGGTRRGIEAAEADIAAAEEANRDVMVSLMAEVALNYIQLRGSQRELAIARQNIKLQRDTLELTQTRFKAGLTGELDVARSRALVASTEAVLPPVQQAISQSIFRLSVLIGRDPGMLLGELSSEAAMPTGPVAFPPGMPSELLRRRPDIRRSERELAAATARIGVATADLFPKFTIVGNLGVQTNRYAHIADAHSGFWSIGPGVSWPIFDAGRIRSQIAVQSARTDAALIGYESNVLLALEEVENAIVAHARDRERRAALAESVAANRRSVELASELYSKGLVDFLSVLDAQKDLFSSEEQLVLVDRAIAADIVKLYKALGGGWAEAAAGHP